MASGHCHTPPCSVRGRKIWGKQFFRLIGPFGLRSSLLRACPPLFGIWTGFCGKSASMSRSCRRPTRSGCRRNLPASTAFATPGSGSRRFGSWLNPSLWFEGVGGQPSWVIVRVYRAPDKSAERPSIDLVWRIKRETLVYARGYFAEVGFECMDGGPALRGEPNNVDFDSLIPLE